MVDKVQLCNIAVLAVSRVLTMIVGFDGQWQAAPFLLRLIRPLIKRML
jgi:hypothetical protein